MFLDPKPIAESKKISGIKSLEVSKSHKQNVEQHKTLMQLYHMALNFNVLTPSEEGQRIIDGGEPFSAEDFRQFEYSALANPIHNLVHRIEVLEQLGAPLAKIQGLFSVIQWLLNHIEPPGTAYRQLTEETNDDRSPMALRTLPTLLPISYRVLHKGKVVQYYKKIHNVSILGKPLLVPEFIPLRIDGVTRTLKAEDEGEGRELLRKLIEIGQRPEWRMNSAFILMDLNGLGITNSFTDGYTDGNRYLSSFSDLVQESLTDSLRKQDFFFRLSGDEFVIIMYNVNPDAVQKAMQRISDSIFVSPKVNAVSLRELEILLDIQRTLNQSHSIEEIEKIAFYHSGIREHIRSYQGKHVGTLKRRLRAFIDRNLRKIQGFRPGVSTGIIMLEPGPQLEDYVTMASQIVNHTKSIYYYQNAPPDAYDDIKRDFLTEEERIQYAYNPNQEIVKPIVFPPKF